MGLSAAHDSYIPFLRFKGFSDTWQKGKFADFIGGIVSGKTKPEKTGTFPVYGSTGAIGFSSSFTHDGETILIARVGANAGTINRVSGKYSVTDNTLIVSRAGDLGLPFVEYFLESFNLNRLVFGTGQPLITGGLLKSINAIFPSGEEQQKIADFLTSVDTRIQQLTQKKTLLERWKKGLMQQLFSQTLRFKDDDGNDFPDWCSMKLGDAAEVLNGFAFKSMSFDDTESNKVLRMSDLKGGRISSDDHALVSCQVVSGLERFALKEGDFLFGMSGSLSNFAWVSSRDLPAYLNQRVGCLRSKSNNVAKFIHYFYLSSSVQRQIASNAAGAAQLNISSEFLRSLKLDLPSRAEQTKIASCLSAIDQKIDTVAKQIEQTKTFKKGLLQQMFV